MDKGFDFRVHLGNQPGVFGDNIPFLGTRMTLPVRFELASPPHFLRIFTERVETWAGWQAHEVRLDDEVLGLLDDPSNAAGSTEVSTFFITDALIPPGGAIQNLIITVGGSDGDNVSPLADDFIITRIEAVGSARVAPAWDVLLQH